MADCTEPLTRSMVSAAVAQYGLAWTTQAPDLIAALFTADAVYVERPFDKAGTFRGRAAIRDYWVKQICGKQTDVIFHHCEGEMVLDAERRVAVVTWLAEFSNHRFRRSEDRTHKRVRFCQVAKLQFSTDGSRITYLEEYSQDASQARFQWPFPIADCSDDQFRAAVRDEPGSAQTAEPGQQSATLAKPSVCESCGATFASRTSLFSHLRSGAECGASSAGASGEGNEVYKVALAISYGKRDASESLEHQIMGEIQHALGAAVALSWSFAVPPCFADAAIVNVVAVSIPSDVLGPLLEQHVTAVPSNNARPIPLLTNKMNTALAAGQKSGPPVQVLWAYQVHRSFDPRRWCESQEFRIVLPWPKLSALQLETRVIACQKLKCAGRLLGATQRASWHNYTTEQFGVGEIVSKVCSPKIRCRTIDSDGEPCTLNESESSGYCAITVSVPGKHVPSGFVRKLGGVLMAHCDDKISEDEISASLQQHSVSIDLPMLSADIEILLAAPRMPRYSAKIGISLDGQDQAFATNEQVTKAHEAQLRIVHGSKQRIN